MSLKPLLLVFVLAFITTELSAQCGTMFETPTDAVKCINKDYSYYAPSGYSNYNWTIINGTKTGGGTSTTNWVSVKWDLPGSTRMVSVTYASGCSSSFYITNMPGQATITGPSLVCRPGTTQSTFSTATGKTGYKWVVPSNLGTIKKNSSGVPIDNASTVDVIWSATFVGTGQISVSHDQTTNSNCKTNGFFYVNVENNVGSVSGPASSYGCTTETYSISGSNPVWKSLVGGTLIDPQGTNPMRITWNGNVSSGSFVVEYTSPAGCSKTKSVSVTIPPIIPTLVPTDAYDPSQYCYKAQRTFVTESGNGDYYWTIKGNTETSPGGKTIYRTKYSSDPNRHIFDVYQGGTDYFYGNVEISVFYYLGLGTCYTATKTVTMNVTPATINFRNNATAYPNICSSSSLNIGAYSTDAGFSNYIWSSPNGTPTAPNGQTTNMNWPTSGKGGIIPITVSYVKSSLNCTNTNLSRNGVTMRTPTMGGASPATVNDNSYYFTSSDGFEFSWAINGETTNPTSWGNFTNQFGTPTTPTGSATWIKFTRNNEPSPFPVVSVNYWLYYGGARISYCTGATKVVDIRACPTCSSRQATDVVSKTDEVSESGIFKAYPTPADNELWIYDVPVGANIKLVSINGAEAINTIQDQESLVKKIETSGLVSGVYVIRTVDLDNHPVSLRVVIKH